MKSPFAGRAEAGRTRLLLLCVGASGAVIGLSALYATRKPQVEPRPFKFPTAELAAIDRDLQARFAVVPDKFFGIERAYGDQHYLYNPQTPSEIAAVSNLKKEKTEVAFYLMSRALWLRSWDGWGFKPIQGPVLLTGKLKTPLPRRVNFEPSDNSDSKEIINQEAGFGADGNSTVYDISTLR